ncbi:MAG: DMT family transporter, partial [Gemmatimonadota bacterium]
VGVLAHPEVRAPYSRPPWRVGTRIKRRALLDAVPDTNANRTLQASGLVVASTLGFGAISVLTLVAMRDGTSLQSVLSLRYALATAALIPVAGGLRALRLPRRRTFGLAGAGGAGQALLTGLGLSALRYLPAATVSFLFYTYPVWVTLLEAATGAERLTRVRVAALVLAVVGLAVMIGSPFSGRLSAAGIALSLAAALVYAVYIPLVGRLQTGVSPTVASTWITIGAGVMYLGASLATHTFGLPVAAEGWGAVVALALFSTVAAFVLFLRGLAVLGPVRTAIISTVEPFFTAILAALVLGQALTLRTFAGGTLIVAAVVLINLGKERRPDAERPGDR